MKGSEFAELTALVAVAEARSFRGAAQRMGVTPSALSRTIGRLEARLGVRLLNRTTRSVSVTEAGSGLLQRLGPLLIDIDQVVSDTAALQESSSGTVRLNLPRLAADLIVTPLLPKFAALHPAIRLELTIDDGLSDVVGQGFDAGIRFGERLARDMVAVRLAPDFRIAVAGSPGYFAGRSVPETPQDLRVHRCVNYRWETTGQLFRWRFEKAGDHVEVDVEGPLVVNDTSVLRDAALGGLGLVCLPEPYLIRSIEEGALVRILEPWCTQRHSFYLYHPSRVRTPAALRTFIDFLQAERPRSF